MRFIFFIILLLSIGSVQAAPKSELWSYWNKSKSTSNEVINHSDWQILLDKYLIISGEHTLFRYKDISTNDKKN